MKIIIPITLLLFFSCSEVKFDKYIGTDLPWKKWDSEYGMPLIYLEDTFESAYFGGTRPKFILYESGRLIYGKTNEKNVVYYQVELSDREIKNIFEELSVPRHSFWGEKNVKSLFKKRIYRPLNRYFLELFQQLTELLDDSNHIITEWRGEPSTRVLIINTHYRKVITVQGGIKSMNAEQQRKYKKILTVYNNIINYENPNAKIWVSDHIELVLYDWSVEYSSSSFYHFEEKEGRHKIFEWPEHFPDLYSQDTTKTDYYEYVLVIKNELYDEFFKYMSEMFMGGLYNNYVIINGKKLNFMQFAYYTPLPNIKGWNID